MVALAMVMDHTGMTQTLAQAAARGLERYYPLVSAFLGVVGSFATGSNTNSNVLLGAFQLQIAQALGLSIPLTLALHNAGAAVGSVFAPAKVMVGCSTVGLTDRESEALRSTARYGLLIILALGGLGLVISWMR